MEKKHPRKAISPRPWFIPAAQMENLQTLGNLSCKPEDILHLCLSSVAMAKVPILWVDSTGRFILVNEEACRFAGYSREEFLSLSVPDIMPDYASLNLRDWIQEISERGALTFESTVRTKEGNILPIEITASFLSLNSREYFFTFFRDITERRQAERALKVPKNITARFSRPPVRPR